MKKALTVVLVLLALMMTASVPARADRAQDRVMKLKEKIIGIQNKGKLDIKNMHPCSSIKMYSVYTKLPKAEINQGETFLVYFEPANFSTERKDGKYHVHLVEDLAVTTSDGKKVLYKKAGFTTLNLTSESPVLDFYFKNSLTKVPAGKYLFKVTLHDMIKGQKVEKVIPFTVKQ